MVGSDGHLASAVASVCALTAQAAVTGGGCVSAGAESESRGRGWARCAAWCVHSVSSASLGNMAFASPPPHGTPSERLLL